MTLSLYVEDLIYTLLRGTWEGFVPLKSVDMNEPKYYQL